MRPKQSTLPSYVRISHGSYQYKGKAFCRVEDGERAMYEKYEALINSNDKRVAASIGRDGGTPIRIAVIDYKKRGLNKELSPTVRKEQERILDVFAEAFQEYEVENVDAQHLRDSLEDLYGNKKEGVVKKRAAVMYLCAVRQFFSWCVGRYRNLKHNPAREVKCKKPAKRNSIWTDQLFVDCGARLKPMLQCYHYASFLLFQRTTDIRLLKWSDVFAEHIYFQPSKTIKSSGLSVNLWITPEIRAVLTRAKAIAADIGIEECAFVFPTEDGTPYQATGIYSAYRRADKAMHGKAIGLHPKGLRPYAATVAQLGGASLDALQVALVHSESRTTQGYMQAKITPMSKIPMRLPTTQPRG